jgi:hypothetical protein
MITTRSSLPVGDNWTILRAIAHVIEWIFFRLVFFKHHSQYSNSVFGFCCFCFHLSYRILLKHNDIFTPPWFSARLLTKRESHRIRFDQPSPFKITSEDYAWGLSVERGGRDKTIFPHIQMIIIRYILDLLVDWGKTKWLTYISWH